MNLLNQLDPFYNNQKIITYNQSTNDIIGAILKQHKKCENDYDKLYYYFDEGNLNNSCKKIFNYLKNNIKYKIEPDNLQTVKTPSAILATGKTTGSDCKNFSLFFAGVLDAIRRNTGQKFDIVFRFASYENKNIPEHVFVVVNPNTNNEIWCDPVLNYLNEKKIPTFYKDKKIKNMALMSLSGVGGVIAPPPPPKKGLLHFVQTAGQTAGGLALPVQTIASLIGLVSGLFKGHSDSYIFDHAFTDKDWNKALGVAFNWYQQRGLDPRQNNDANIWYAVGTNAGVSRVVPQPYMSMKRIEWLPFIWENTKNPDLGNIINDAINQGFLNKKYFINSKNEMAPEPSIISNLFGQKQDGEKSGISTPLLLGGAALAAFLIFKRK